MAFNVVLFLAGLILASLTLRDVFDTVVVPGGSRTSLHVANRLVLLSLPLWKRVRGRRRGVSPSFGPFVLVSCFVIWMGLLTIAFGLMAYALRADFDPPIRGFGEAAYLTGSSLVTVGLSHISPAGAGRWVILGAGFCGLAVMTMAVTYLLEVQGSISRRDTGIIKLNTSAGEPPSGLSLLERFAAIRNRQALRELLEEARTWCATVRQSHSSHPSLIYFQSIGTGSGWPAALGAVLDLGLFAEELIDDDDVYGPAVLLRHEGSRMALELARVVGVRSWESTTDPNLLEQVAQRLGDSGYPLRGDVDFGAVSKRRSEYMSCIDALADHLGKPSAVLIRLADRP